MHFTVYDLETTGLVGSIGDVVQFAYVNLDENFNCIEAECMYFYRKGMHWSAEAEAIHHIPRSYLAQFESEYERNLKKMYITLQRSNAVGFNSDAFDNRFSYQWLKRMGMPEVEFNSSYDVMSILQPVFGVRPKLTSVPKRIGLDEDIINAVAASWFGKANGPHDARYDVTATAMAFSYAVRKKYIELDLTGKAAIKFDKKDESFLDGQGDLTEANFSEFACYVIETETSDRRVINLCSEFKDYTYLNISMADAESIKENGSINGMSFPKRYVDAVTSALNSGIVFKESGEGIYTTEIIPGLLGTITVDNNKSTFKVGE